MSRHALRTRSGRRTKSRRKGTARNMRARGPKPIKKAKEVREENDR